MKEKMTNNSKVSFQSVTNWIIFGGMAVTLYFNANARDPFNSPKLWVLMLVSTWVTGFLVFNIKPALADKSINKSILLILFFVISYAISAFVSPIKFTAFFGENQRRDGFITYLAFAIIMIATIIFFKENNLDKVFNASLIILAILSFYGYMQLSGEDFVNWNNPYNSIISTLGNPNFAAAAMAIFSVILFGIIFMNQKNVPVRLSSLLLLTFTLYIIIQSEARQGLLAFMLGAIIIFISFTFNKYRSLGITLSVLFGAVGVFAILGMLQIGPLTNYLYKSSVTVRGYYWRAGIKMFQENPLFGVGVDRFGAYFKEYRESTYPLLYGFNITSTNAHNVFIQQFATAGVIVGLSYLLLTIYIFVVGLKNVVLSNGNAKIINATIFAAWIAYQAQSVISIDSLGVAYWGWFLGGAIIAMAKKDFLEKLKTNSTSKQIQSINVKRVLLSTIMTIPVLIICVFFYRGEVNMQNQMKWYRPSEPSNKPIFLEAANKTLESKILEPYYRIDTGAYLSAMGYPDQGLTLLRESLAKDPRNIDNLQILAAFSEQLNTTSDVVKYREAISKLDPWNADNYFKLGLAYKALGRFSEMQEMLKKIESFASNTEEAKSARVNLVQN